MTDPLTRLLLVLMLTVSCTPTPQNSADHSDYVDYSQYGDGDTSYYYDTVHDIPQANIGGIDAVAPNSGALISAPPGNTNRPTIVFGPRPIQRRPFWFTRNPTNPFNTQRINPFNTHRTNPFNTHRTNLSN
ncbi:uncharacterized protein LOC121872007 isoform X2 [Homarus americanus]|uniref:uncharacterized protein LOC121872007 isoform X2 n=1 Tax=Homarus americanus TaxID=6706 RepID=UPI001C4482EB|nr:uncharacterized protein LOC121872007 isoform X2 [Homarus americanus]